MVPVTVDVKVPEVDEVSTPVTSTDPVPEECSKRPVPPVIVQEPVKWKVVAEVGQATSFDELNSLSPLAAVKVYCSVAVNLTWHDAGPVTVARARTVYDPR